MKNATKILFCLLLITSIASCKKEDTTVDVMSGNYKGTLQWVTLDGRDGEDLDFTFNITVINKDMVRLTLNTEAPLFSKVFELPYTGVVLRDYDKSYIFEAPASVGYSLLLSINVPDDGGIVDADFQYVKTMPGNGEDFAGKGIKY